MINPEDLENFGRYDDAEELRIDREERQRIERLNAAADEADWKLKQEQKNKKKK